MFRALALAASFALCGAAAAKDGRQLFNFFADQVAREIEREQARQFEREERQRLRAQRREYERQYEQLLPNWRACLNGDVTSCDRALASPILSDDDRATLSNARAAHGERQDAEARDRERAQREREQAARQAEERRVAALRAFGMEYENCRTYSIAACDAALAFDKATPQDLELLRSWRAVAARFVTDRAACEAGSLAACDAALASPAASPQTMTDLRERRAAASPFGRALSMLSNPSASSGPGGIPLLAFAIVAVVLASASALYWKRRTISAPGTPPLWRIAGFESLPALYENVRRHLVRMATPALKQASGISEPTPPAAPSIQAPRDPVTAIAALELAHAYMRDVQQGLGDVSDPAHQAAALNELSLASKQLAIAEKADPTATFAVDNGDGFACEATLTNLKARALFLEGVCRAQSDAKRAIAILKQAVALEPADADAHYWIGLLYAGRMHKAEAVAALKTAVALDPKNLMYRKELGRAENISGAQIAFDRAASGARTTTRALKWAGLLIVASLVIAFVVNVADPETRAGALMAVFGVAAMIGMIVSMVKTIWRSVTGQE